MKPLSAHISRSTQGFTLIETTIIIFIVGVLGAIAAPSFISWQGKNKVNNALQELRGALQASQRQAMRKSKNCIVYVPDGNQITGTCLPNGTIILPKGVGIASSTLTPKQVQFSFKGNTADGGTIVVSATDSSTSYQRCLVVSPGIGLMRTGQLVSGNCNTSEFLD